ncbi:MAG TPA: tetratricopeptide repeat protein [Polyangia bacterium]
MGTRRGLAIAAVVCALVAPAHAITEEDERAKAHFLAGQSYYDQASYADALREFNEAYRISKRPALLYNVARCHEALEEYADAVKLLQRYLDEDPQTTDRAAVEARIAALKEREAARDQAQAAAPAEAQKPPSTAQPPPATASAPVAPAPRKRLYTWIVGGVGVAALAAALGTGVASQLDYNDLSSKCTGNACDPAMVANAQSKINSGKKLALATDVLWPIGAAAVVAGVVLFFVEGRHASKERARLILPLVGPSLGGLAVAHDF